MAQIIKQQRIRGLSCILFFCHFLFILPGLALANEQDLCKEPRIECGKTPSVTFDEKGRLWATFFQENQLYVNYSDYTGNIRFTRSLDGGKSYEPAKNINDDGLPISHRFDELHLSENGRLHLFWLDKRDKEQAKKQNKDYAGSALYYSYSDDMGESFSRNQALAHNSCECCRIASSALGKDELVLFWRQIFEQNTRDHAMLHIDSSGKISTPIRATQDDWQINACPHHGPDLLTDKQGRFHMAWFSQGTAQKGLYYGYISQDLKTTGHIQSMDSRPGAEHPQLARRLLPNGLERLYFVWKYFDGQKTLVYQKQSDDNGKTWTKAKKLTDTTEKSDHPLLISYQNQVYLSWLTGEGYQFQVISGTGASQ